MEDVNFFKKNIEKLMKMVFMKFVEEEENKDDDEK